jgi:hypothetical protein
MIGAEVLPPAADGLLRDGPRLVRGDLRVLPEPPREVLDRGPAVPERLAVGVLVLDDAIAQPDADDAISIGMSMSSSVSFRNQGTKRGYASCPPRYA